MRSLCSVAAAVAAGIVLSSPLCAQTVVKDFSDGPPDGRYAFASTTPKAFPDLVRGNMQGDAYNAALKGCSALGATVEGNKAAREKAAAATVAFLKKVFAR